jgi:hypothetical protein
MGRGAGVSADLDGGAPLLFSERTSRENVEG